MKKQVKTFSEFTRHRLNESHRYYIAEGLKYYLENPEYLIKMATDMNRPPKRLVGEEGTFPPVDLRDETNAYKIWVEKYFYEIKDYLNQKLQVMSSPEPNLNWNNRADVGMRLSSYEPNEGFKNFFLEINNLNNNLYIRINIEKEVNEVKCFNGISGDCSRFFAPDSIERVLDVCSLVTKNFMGFELDVNKLADDLLNALGKDSKEYYLER